MTHFTTSPHMVRCEFFRPAGKWGYTVALDMNSVYHEINVYTAVAKALEEDAHAFGLWAHHWAVVLEPYHPNGYPVMLPPRNLGPDDTKTILAAVAYQKGELAHAH